MSYEDCCDSCIFNYCQIFTEENDGIPPGCHHRCCLLDHRNTLFNDNTYVRKLGLVGYEYFDKNRRVYFGIACILTLISMVVTTYGCFSLSLYDSVLFVTYWAAATGTNTTSQESFAIYYGLRAEVMVTNCPFASEYLPSCNSVTAFWRSKGCSTSPTGISIFNPVNWANTYDSFQQSDQVLLQNSCDYCADVAINLWLLCLGTCASLTLSYLGAQTRMRKRGSDVPVQKLLGMFGETGGFIFLAFSLVYWHSTCYGGLKKHLNEDQYSDITIRFWLGPGFYCFVVCCIIQGYRMCIHWLVPIPRMGKGLCKIWGMLYSDCCCGAGKETRSMSWSQDPCGTDVLGADADLTKWNVPFHDGVHAGSPNTQRKTLQMNDIGLM